MKKSQRNDDEYTLRYFQVNIL